jgi:hypothetical protein
MTKMKALLSIALGALALVGVSAAQAALLGVVQPCLSAAATGVGGNPGINLLPINGGNQTYCQSAYGWSDTWFANSQPSTYDQHLDVLSGDNAPTLFWIDANGNPHSTGNLIGALGPYLDGGSLNAQFIGSNVTVLQDITVNGNVGTSKLTIGGLEIDITTTVTADGLTEAFTFTNNDASISQLYFDDYFNFHANGSLPGDIGCPTTSIEGADPNTIHTVGANGGGCSQIVHDGIMFGSLDGGTTALDPAWWYLGLSTAVLGDMANNLGLVPPNLTNTFGTLNNTTSFTGDGAGDLVWSLGALGLNQSITLTVVKEQRAPEPATLGLFGLGLLALGFFRRRS